MIVVLWAAVGLGAVTTSMVSTGRNDLALARNLREAATAEAAADGAIQRAALHLLPCRGDGCAAWPTDGSRVPVASADATVGICVVDESGRVDPNSANPALLGALLTAVGVAPDEAGRLAAAIAQWRSPATPDVVRAQAELYRAAGLPFAPDGRRFADADDLRFVLGMTPAIMERLRPNLSVFVGGEPNAALAPPAVRTALRSLGLEVQIPGFPVGGAPGRTMRVVASAATPGGGQFVRVAQLRLEVAADRPPLRILTWSTGSAAECR